MVNVTIRLIGEEPDRLFHIDLDPQVEFQTLLNTIEKLTKIPFTWQRIMFRNKNIPYREEHPLESIKDSEELIVDHNQMKQWELYKKAVSDVRMHGVRRTHVAEDAVRYHTRLMETGFFNVYPTFNDFREKYHHKVAAWADVNVTIMREAILSHFWEKTTKKKDIFCWYETRSKDLSGKRKHILAFVELPGEKKPTKYHVKCHHYGPLSLNQVGQPSDIKEYFCYKVLELINVGPLVQFILQDKVFKDRTAMYIATNWRDDFVALSKCEKEEISLEALIQVQLIANILFIEKLHCGQWKDTKDAAIIDFLPRSPAYHRNYRIRQKKASPDIDLFANWDSVHVAMLENCEKELRLKLTKEYLIKWNLLFNIDEANRQIQCVKDEMEKQQLNFKNYYNPTEELDEYIRNVKQNLNEMTEMLNLDD